jgi:hypothetical protein
LLSNAQVVLRALSHSRDRAQFDSYFSIDGASKKFVNVAPKDLKSNIIQELVRLFRDHSEAVSAVNLMDIPFKCMPNNVLVLHKFDMRNCCFCELVEELVNLDGANFKVIITAFECPSHLLANVRLRCLLS